MCGLVGTSLCQYVGGWCGSVDGYMSVSMFVVDVGWLMGTCLCQCVVWLVGTSVSVCGWVGGYMFFFVGVWVG